MKASLPRKTPSANALPSLPPAGVVKTIRGGRKEGAEAPQTGTVASTSSAAVPAAIAVQQPPPVALYAVVNVLNELQLSLLRAVRREDEVAVHRAAGGTDPPGRTDDSATGTTLVDSTVSVNGALPSLAYLIRTTDWTAPATRTSLSDVNYVGNLLMLWAAMRGQDDLIEVLVKAGVSPNTVLPWADGGASNPVEAARLADLVEEVESHQLPLILAAQNNRLSTTKLLLASGANVNGQASQGWTALLRASFYGYPDIVSALLANGASLQAVNSDGMTALHGAIHGSHLACARLLLDGGGSYSIKDNFGHTATLLARTEGSLPLFSLLWAAASSRKDRSVWTEVDPETQRTPLHDLARLKAPMEMFEPLMPADATTVHTPSPVTVPDSNGASPLIYAALSGSPELVNFLIRRGLPLFPHPTIDRALPTVVSLLSQLSRPSPLPDPAAKLRELAKVDAAALASEARFPNPGAMKRAADLRAGSTDALVSLLSACGIVKESRSVVLSELDAVLRGMEAEVTRVRGARGGLKEAADFDPAKEAKVKELWAQLQTKLGPITTLIGPDVSAGLVERTKGEIDEMLRKRVGESLRQEKRARVQEDGVRKLGHAVKHAAKWTRTDLERWDGLIRDVEKALDTSIVRQRELLGRCILLSDSAGRECMEQMSNLADAGEEAAGELRDLQARLEENSKLGVWCKGKLRKLEKIAATRTGLDSVVSERPPLSSTARTVVPMAARPVVAQQTGPVWISSKGKVPAGGVAVLPAAVAAAPSKPPEAPKAVDIPKPVSDSVTANPTVAPPRPVQPGSSVPVGNLEIPIPSSATTEEAAGPWSMMKNMVNAVAGFGMRTESDAPAQPMPQAAAAVAAKVSLSPEPAQLSIASATTGKAQLPTKVVRKGPPPPEKSLPLPPPQSPAPPVIAPAVVPQTASPMPLPISTDFTAQQTTNNDAAIPPMDSQEKNDLDAAAALDRKVAALQAKMDAPTSPSGSPRASPTMSPALKRSTTAGSTASGKRKNNLASILDKYGM